MLSEMSLPWTAREDWIEMTDEPYRAQLRASLAAFGLR
jgi:hypothetical protein